MAKRVVLASLEGYNGTIFAYGQTGSGKTYTMMGSENSEAPPDERKRSLSPFPGSRKRSVSPFKMNRSFMGDNSPAKPKEKGIILHALEDLYSSIRSNENKDYTLTCSYVEIYNEQVYDLLVDSSHFKNETLAVSEDPHRGFYIKGVTDHTVSSMEEVLSLIDKGEDNRKYAATAMNHFSSRSHTIFRLNVTSVTHKENRTTESMLNFVDLAGSERVSNLADTSLDQKAKRQRFANIDTLINEGKHINTSLFYLCQVINRLSKSGTVSEKHIPYRNSNLTKILRSSLGGNSLTCIICTATPALSQFEMTLSTLRFGGTASTITNQVAANIRSNYDAEVIEAYKQEIDQLKAELQEALKSQAQQDESAKTQLQEKLEKLTHILFDQSKECADEASKQKQVWVNGPGDLMLDSRLSEKKQEIQVKFDEKGEFALERMRELKREIKKKETEIDNLREGKQNLLDSRNNLKNDLKKALGLCKELSDQKQKYKNKYKDMKKFYKTLETKLSILEKQEGLEKLSCNQLQQLETFFFHALDSVKNAKFHRKYQEKMSKIKPMPQIPESPVKTRSLKLWKSLGLSDPADLSDSDSNNSSMDFESSFYNTKKNKENESYESQDLSALMWVNLLDQDKMSPICVEEIQTAEFPFSEVSNLEK